ncbi:MAG: tetratricopeptide repeat protein [Crocinitomicaceae bacterium]|nr:tetratricopeptide repeat protein [Crocinitomicaceae bacterium]
MNLNRLYKMFGSKSRLSREDITNYGSTSDESVKHSIEMQSSSGSFESDAIEGWDQLSYDTTAMKNLDGKFLSTSYTGYYILGGLVAVGITAVLLLNNSGTEEKKEPQQAKKETITTLMEDQEITYDESDLIIPEKIEQMTVAPESKQVKPSKMVEVFQEMKSTYVPPAEEIEVEMLPYLNLYQEPTTPVMERVHNHAKEIYLHDLKLVDYSNYRYKPTVKAKRLVLTGLSADMEGKESEPAEPIWKDVDIAYSSYIDKSIGVFSKGSYKRALTRFETVIETYHDDVNANFYAGMCLYNLREYQKSIDAFKNCIYGPFSNFDEESQWMIALSYDKLGERTQARKYYTKIIEQGGFYKKQALAKMK